jgi:carbon monoxide dehydrogenase subunit G
MPIELEHTFAVPVPPEQAWNVLLDVARVAPCMPGATVDEVDGDVVTGKIKVKVGPIALTYTGKATFTERDAEAHAVRVEAAGKETRGSGTASATVQATLEEDGGQTRVRVHTSLNVTGKPAQFGRGVMAEVGGRLIEKFSANLAELLASDDGSGQAPERPRVQVTSDARLAIPIQELSLPVRSYNSLKGEGIDTVGQLVAHTQSELLAIKNIGERSVQEIEEKLGDLGLSLTEEEEIVEHITVSLNGNGPAVHPQEPEAAGPAPAAAPATAPAGGEDEAEGSLDLLGVVAGPILKRLLPAVAGAVVLGWLGIRLRRRGRHRAG